MSTVGRYHEYTGVYLIHWRDIMINVGKGIGKTVEFV